MDRSHLREWHAALLAATRHEFVPKWLRDHVAKPPESWRCSPQPSFSSLPDVLHVGLCGAGISGTYRQCFAGGGTDAAASLYTFATQSLLHGPIEAQLRFAPDLGLWAISTRGTRSCRVDLSITYYELDQPSLPDAQVLLYVGGPACDDPRAAEWVSVLGQCPPPTVASRAEPVPRELGPLPSFGGCWDLPAEPAAAALAWLLDLRSACVTPGSYFEVSANLDTAPHIAARIYRHAEEALCLGAVCKAWCRVLHTYREGWRREFNRMLLLSGSHGQPVASPSLVLRVLAQAHWQDMLWLTHKSAFAQHAWPIIVKEVKLSVPTHANGEGYDYSGYKTLQDLCTPFASLARSLLHDVPLPWVKRLKTRPVPAEGMTSTNGGDRRLTANLVKDIMVLTQRQCPASRGTIFISPVGFVTPAGARLKHRLHPALRELRQALPSFVAVAQSSIWVSSFRDGNEPCQFCAASEDPEASCAECRDKRSWSSLAYSWSLRFNGDVDGQPTSVDFSLGGDVFPFVGGSCDDALREELSRFGAFGPLDLESLHNKEDAESHEGSDGDEEDEEETDAGQELVRSTQLA